MIGRAGVLAVLCLCGAAAGAEPPEAETRDIAIIGVRAEARPFAWYDSDNDSPNGFLWDLCTTAAINAGYAPQPRPVTARERAVFLLGDQDLGIDVLCDPTTISMERTRQFLTSAAENPAMPRLSFSPIVFLANGTYFSRDGIGSLKGAAEAPADRSGCHLIRTAQSAEPRAGAATAQADEPRELFLMAGFVHGTTSEDAIRKTAAFDLARERRALPQDQYLCAVEFENHSKGVEEFCTNANDRIELYFGDRDIVEAYMDHFEAERGLRCPARDPRPRMVRNEDAAISYEPYALVITDRTPGFRDDFTKGLYEIFHRKEVVKGLFATHFPGRVMSRYLATLYDIYAIP